MARKGRLRGRKGGACAHILDIGGDVPYNVQRMCSVVWEHASGTKKVDSEVIGQSPVIVARQDSAHYEMLWQTATQTQKTRHLWISYISQANLFC